MGRLKAMVGSSSLNRLRVAFVVLGLLLLTPLGLLMKSANERLEGQRRLRHQVVGERIFDELERELTDLLRREMRRPSLAYDQYTKPEAWAPFIVGYFTASPHGTSCVAEDRLDAERRKELARVLPIWLEAYRAAPLPSGAAEGHALDSQNADSERADAEHRALQRALEESDTLSEPSVPMPAAKPIAAEQSARKSSPQVLQQLNRAPESRAKPSSPRKSDPMQDYSVGY